LLTDSHISSSFNDLTSSIDSLKNSGHLAIADINSEVLSTSTTILMTFTLSYLGMISTETKSLSPVDLDNLISMMKKHNMARHKGEPVNSSSPSMGRKTAPITKSPRVKKKMQGDIGPNIAVLPLDESPRQRSSSFNERKKLPTSEKAKKHSFDGTLSTDRSLLNQQQQNSQHSEIIDGGNQSIITPDITIDYDTVEDLTSLKSTAEFASLSVELPKRNVVLILSSESIILKDANDNKIIRKKKITEIASCTQVSCEPLRYDIVFTVNDVLLIVFPLK